MRKRYTVAWAVAVVLAATLTACGLQADATPTPMLTATHTRAASPTPSHTLVRIRPTISPTSVPSPSAEPSAAPPPCTEPLCLTASPMPVAADGTITLTWNAPGAAKVAIHWQGKQQETIVHSDLSPVGSLSFAVADVHIQSVGPYVYVWLTAEYADGDVESWSQGWNIPVRTGHSITAFAVAPQTVDPGDPVRLSWDVAGEVQDVTLWTLSEGGQLYTSYGDLAASGSMTLMVPEWRRNHMSFQLYASDVDGLWTIADASVTITCPDVWFFPNPPAGCPQPAHYTKMAVQLFEHGMMIWTEWEDRIRVFFDDSPDVHLRSWSMQPNQWFAGMPESDPAISAPPGYHQPVRGFGVLWREGWHRGTPIRDLLGWAIEPEFAIDRGAVQCDTAPKYSTCYIGDPNGVVYVEQPESSGWYEWAAAGPDTEAP